MQAQYYTSKLSEVEIIKAFDKFCQPTSKSRTILTVLKTTTWFVH